MVARLFHKAQDYHAFLSILALAKARPPVKLFAFVDAKSFSLCDRVFASPITESIHAMAFDQPRSSLSQALRKQRACVAGQI
jgi:hypothetical protein